MALPLYVPLMAFVDVRNPLDVFIEVAQGCFSPTLADAASPLVVSMF